MSTPKATPEELAECKRLRAAAARAQDDLLDAVAARASAMAAYKAAVTAVAVAEIVVLDAEQACADFASEWNERGRS